MELKLIFLITTLIAVSSNSNLTRRNIAKTKSNYRSVINASAQATFCYAIKQNGNEPHIYFNITAKWIPKYSRAGCITACIIVSLFSFAAVTFGIKKLLWKLKGNLGIKNICGKSKVLSAVNS